MKKLITFAIFTFAMTATAVSAAELKAAFINSAIILQQAPQAQKAIADMKSEFEQRENALRALSEEIQKEEQNMQKDAAVMSPEQKKKMNADLVEKKRKLRFDAQSLQEDLDLRRKQEIQKLRTEIAAVIKKYSEDNGYHLVFTEGVAYAHESVDITDEILKELQK